MTYFARSLVIRDKATLTPEQENLIRVLGPSTPMTILRPQVRMSVKRIKREAQNLGVTLMDPEVARRNARLSRIKLDAREEALIREFAPKITLKALAQKLGVSARFTKSYAIFLGVPLRPIAETRREAMAKLTRWLTADEVAILRAKAPGSSVLALSREIGVSSRVIRREAERLGIALLEPKAAIRLGLALGAETRRDPEWKRARQSVLRRPIDRFLLSPEKLREFAAMVEQGDSVKAMAASLGVATPTLHRWIRDRLLDWLRDEYPHLKGAGQP